ncbi:hypothetical protein BX661DRAFT_197564 [Kickxella alabastrina]|uniref:uncharacterized protein n=1 Tax=Kickxella alabastrina TaxID=61397 RepID=UPI002220A8B8|nr:uncharacterized protein BX661DRAFT_197564 [Kickxella alabastrina]KAI7831029.1 hypothetical protein BX661DRAFT_197564 [Kickxella alabastrina]
MANFHLPNNIVLMILNCVVAKPATKHLPREFSKAGGADHLLERRNSVHLFRIGIPTIQVWYQP